MLLNEFNIDAAEPGKWHLHTTTMPSLKYWRRPPKQTEKI